MDKVIIAVLCGLAFVAFAAAVIYGAMRLKDEVPDEDREFLDPLPKLLRMLWPLIRLVDYHLCRMIPQALLSGPAEALRLSGLLYLMSPTQFIALCLVSLTFFAAFTAFVLSAADMFSWLALALFARLHLPAHLAQGSAQEAPKADRQGAADLSRLFDHVGRGRFEHGRRHHAGGGKRAERTA